MRPFALIACLFIAIIAFAETPRGITTTEQSPLLPTGSSADYGFLPQDSRDISYKTPSAFATTLDSIGLRVVLQPGEYFAVFVDAEAGTLGFEPQRSPLDSALEWWVSRAPDFLQT